jgi:O-antigen/teichoic acid export membrane protein
VYAVVVVVVLTTVWQISRTDPSPLVQMAVIAGGSILAAVLEVALSYTLPGATRPRFRWDAEARGALLHFGGWIFLSTACTFLASQADRLVVGKLSLETLGVYHVAATIAALPAALVTALGMQVAFPRVSEAVRRDGEPGAAFRRAHRGLVVFAGLLATGAVCVGPLVIALVYDQRYAAASGFLQLLGLYAWVTMLIVPGELWLLAHDQPRALAVGQGVRLACLPGVLYAGYQLAGVNGLIYGMAAGEAVRYAVVAAYVRKSGERLIGFDLALTLTAAAVAGVYLVAEPAVLGGAPLAVRAAAGAAALTAFWAGVYLALVDATAARRFTPAWGRRALTGARP